MFTVERKWLNSLPPPSTPEQLQLPSFRGQSAEETQEASRSGRQGKLFCRIQTGSSSLATKEPEAVQRLSLQWHRKERLRRYLWQQAAGDGSLQNTFGESNLRQRELMRNPN